MIRGFIFGKDDGTEEILMAKQKEKITKVTYELENKRRKSKFDNLVEIRNLDGAIHIDNNRKLDKKNTKQRLSVFSMILKEYHDKKMKALKEKLKKMTEKLKQFNKEEYVDMSDRPEDINRFNLEKVINYVNIVSLKNDKNDIDTASIEVGTKFYDECLNHEFNVMRS